MRIAAVICAVVGLAFDIIGAAKISWGVIRTGKVAQEVSTGDMPRVGSTGVVNPHLSDALKSAGKDACWGLVFFVLGFLGQATAAMLTYFS